MLFFEFAMFLIWFSGNFDESSMFFNYISFVSSDSSMRSGDFNAFQHVLKDF